jgi:hypothetical protein
MRQVMLLGILLLAGCKSIIGPFQHRSPERVDDPRLPIYEQERRGRDRYAIMETDPNVLPKTYSEYYGPNHR